MRDSARHHEVENGGPSGATPAPLIAPLIAVVGPSGAGKDTLIRAARAARPGLHVARRVITRPPGSGFEDFDSIDPQEFERRRQAGAFALSWQAHGLHYAVPAGVARVIAAGRPALFNGSRAALPAARERFPSLRVILVTAAPATLAARLARRSRETEAQIAARLARADLPASAGPDIRTVRNDGALAEGLAAFLAALDAIT